MDLATRKLYLLEKFIKISSKEKIEKLEDFFKKEIAEENDIWDKLPDVVQQIVEKSKEESRKGQVIPHGKVIAKVKAKYKII